MKPYILALHHLEYLKRKRRHPTADYARRLDTLELRLLGCQLRALRRISLLFTLPVVEQIVKEASFLISGYDRRLRRGLGVFDRTMCCLLDNLPSGAGGYLLGCVLGHTAEVGDDDGHGSRAGNLERYLARHILQSRMLQSKAERAIAGNVGHHLELQAVVGRYFAVAGDGADPGELTFEPTDVGR